MPPRDGMHMTTDLRGAGAGAVARAPSARYALAGALAALLVSLAAALALQGTLGSGGHARPAPASPRVRSAAAQLPLSARTAISATLGSQEPAYRVRSGASGALAANPAQRLRMSFSRSGVTLRSGSLLAGMRLSAVSAGARARPSSRRPRGPAPTASSTPAGRSASGTSTDP